MGINANKSDYTFNVLHEEVSSSDLFPDKTHEHVTDTLFKLIDTSDKGITVGIEGSWGSGKSTVVELLKGKISSEHNDKSLFFLFDAWAHEGDPLRRIFLDSLITVIDPKSDDFFLNKLLTKISCRTKTVEVTTEKKASKLGKLIFLSALMVPIGAALLSAVDYKTLTWPWSPVANSIYGIFLCGLLLSFAPLVTIFLWSLFGEKDKQNRTKWDFMASDSTENYVQDITEDGERTSIEFEKYFAAIIKYALDKNEGKRYERIIIVIDNLDRVSTEHAIAIWSTLQTFFQHRSNQNNNNSEWMRCLWFLVPYDREGLSRIWGYDHEDTKNLKISDLSKSFLSKNFQVVVEVPTPVMSAWYDYCVRCVNKSLLQWPDADRTSVIRAYQRYGSRLDVSPTPRQIHNFINQVGVIGMRWGGIMAAESIALYAILRQNCTETELRQKLLNHGLPNNFEVSGNAEEIKMELAGILFGVPKNKGIQLLIGPVIRDAMINGDGKIISKLIEEHGEAFWIVWNAIKSDVSITESHVEEYRIAATQAMHNGMLKEKSRIYPEIKALEKAWCSTTDKWDMKQNDYANSIPLMAELVENKSKFVSWCNKVVSEKLKKLISLASDKAIAVDDLVQIEALILFLSNNEKPLKHVPYSELTLSEWTYWLEVLKEAEVSLPCVLPMNGVISELASTLLQKPTILTKENISILIDTLEIHPSSNEWEDVSVKMVIWGNTPNREIGVNQAYDLMLAVLSLCEDNASSQIINCINESGFWQRGRQETLDSVKTLPILSACALGAEIQENNHISEEVKQYWRVESIDDVEDEEVLDLLGKFDQMSVIWELARDDSNKLAIAIIKSNQKNSELYANPKGLHYLGDYKWIEDSDRDIVYNLCEIGNVSGMSAKFNDDPLLYAHNLYLLKCYGNAEAKELVKQVVESMTTELWENSLRDNSYTLDCVLDENVSVDHKFLDAFEKHFSNTMIEDVTNDWLWENFDGLLNKTIDTDIMLQKLTEKYFDTSEDILSEKAFNALSRHFAPFIQKLDHTKVMSRVCFWLDQKSRDRIKWLLDSGYTTEFSPTDSLSSRVNCELKDSQNTDDINLLNKIAKIFGVVIVQNKEMD